MGWAGLRLDPERNGRGELRISTEGSPLGAYAIPTDEEWLIARDTVALLRS
jgi:acetate kinase